MSRLACVSARACKPRCVRRAGCVSPPARTCLREANRHPGDNSASGGERQKLSARSKHQAVSALRRAIFLRNGPMRAASFGAASVGRSSVRAAAPVFALELRRPGVAPARRLDLLVGKQLARTLCRVIGPFIQGAGCALITFGCLFLAGIVSVFDLRCSRIFGAEQRLVGRMALIEACQRDRHQRGAQYQLLYKPASRWTILAIHGSTFPNFIRVKRTTV